MHWKAVDRYRRRQNVTEHDKSGKTKQKGDDMQQEDGESGGLTADRNGMRQVDVLCQ